MSRSLYTTTYGDDEMEGYVVRLADAFPYGAFRRSVVKYVAPAMTVRVRTGFMVSRWWSTGLSIHPKEERDCHHEFITQYLRQK